MIANRTRWNALCQRIKAKDDPVSGTNINRIFDQLIATYTGPDRFYHDLNHINDGLRLLDWVKCFNLAVEPDSLEVAWWFHDVIYDTTSHTNEEASAAVAINVLKELSFPSSSLANIDMQINVVQLIMATKHDHIPASKDGQLIVDIDLASLGTPQEIFDQNTANIRKEYAHVSDEDFIQGRANFFRKFLEGRSSIYLTECFRGAFEIQAQENLRRVIAEAV